MHNVYRLPDHNAHSVAHPATELDVILVTRQLAERLASSPSADAGLSSPPALGWLGRAGLFGVSVCAEHGGPDIANAVIAEMIALLAGADVQVAKALAGHFQVIDVIRAAEATRPVADFLALALSGNFFLLASELSPDFQNEGHEVWPSLTPVRGGFRLEVSLPRSQQSFPQWLAVPTLDPAGQRVLALLAPHELDEAATIEREAKPSDHAFSGIIIPTSHVFPIPYETTGASTFAILDNLLHAAIDLGLSRSIFAALGRELNNKYNSEPHASDPQLTFAVQSHGRFAAQLEGVSALIERAGQHIDMVQVDHAADLLQQASLSAGSAFILASDLLNDLYDALDQNAADIPDAAAVLQLKSRAKARSTRSTFSPRQETLGLTHARGAVPPRWPFAY